MPTLELIVACGKNRVIGLNGQVPWHLPEDLKHFKATTMGCPVIMGRKTWSSIGRPLPGRTNIVMTRNPDFVATGALVASDIEGALRLASNAERIFILGGGELYQMALPLVDVAWVTEIDASPQGDTFFPQLSPNDWEREVLRELPAAESRPALTFCRYQRKRYNGAH